MAVTIGLTRRSAIRTGVAALAAPLVLRHALGDAPIKIGMPCALTGPGGEVGEQMRRGAESWVKQQNAAGGLLGRPIELQVEDTGGTPPPVCARRSRWWSVTAAGCCSA
jgi:ABC-type branched-subunit amino acid transport system substrate-binding protein